MKTKQIIVLISIVVLNTYAFSQDRQFVRTYQSTVLPKGAMDLEGWATFRTGRAYFYNRLDTRLEFEIGLGDKVQTAVYFNASHKAFSASIDTLGGIADTSFSGVFSSSEFSVSSEWKWKLLDPSVNKIGLGLYAELTVAPNEFEIENKIIIDKKTEKNIFALNLVNEYEVEAEVDKGKADFEEWKDGVEIDMGYMRMLKPNFGLGIEMRNHNEIVEDDWEHSALFGGPTLYYAGEKNFIILNVLPQWTNLKKTDDAPNNLVLNEHEKFEIRLLIGFGL